MIQGVGQKLKMGALSVFIVINQDTKQLFVHLTNLKRLICAMFPDQKFRPLCMCLDPNPDMLPQFLLNYLQFKIKNKSHGSSTDFLYIFIDKFIFRLLNNGRKAGGLTSV